MRSWMLALSIAIGLGAAAGPSLATLGRDVLTLNGGVLSIQRDYETPGGSGTLYLTFNKVS